MPSNLKRFATHRMNILETCVLRFNIGQDYMDENDWMRLAEAIEGVDYEKLMRVVDRNHAKHLASGNLNFMDIVEKRRQELRERGEIK